MLANIVNRKNQLKKLSLLLSFAFVAFFLSHPLLGIEYKGRANAWLLYLQDDFGATSVIDVYENASCSNPGEVDYVVIGKNLEDVLACAERCCEQRVIKNGETVLERKVENPDGSDTTSTSSSSSIGSTFISSMGIDAEAKEKKNLGKMRGNFKRTWTDSRALYGSQKNSFRFTDLYYEHKDLDYSKPYAVSLGRRAVDAGILVDGVYGQYYFGPSEKKETKKIGFFGGLAPNPITKEPSLDFTTFGFDFSYIPQFSTSNSETKFKLDTSIVSELYKGSWNRLYLFSKSHFTPTNNLSFFHYSTIELPAPSGDDSALNSSHFSFQGVYRPDRYWFFSMGFTQFRIDRYLKEESVRWLTDDNSYQSDRVGETLDRSHRFRLDFKTSYKPIPITQPYLRVRLERRGIDSNKKLLNADPSSTDPAVEDLRLVDKKNAYKMSIGNRLFPLSRLETDTQLTYNQRFLSKSYDIFQSAFWQGGDRWSVDGYLQMVWSERNISNSSPSSATAGTNVDATDYYLGIGGSYKFPSDLLAQIRYDFACEDDYSLDTNIFIHSILARIDYRF